MSAVGRSAYQFDLSGGLLCLDFANTLSRRDDPARQAEHLARCDDLVRFAEQCEIIEPQQAGELLAHARQHRGDANRLLRQAIRFRESLYRTFSAAAEGKPASADDLQQITEYVMEALQHRNLRRRNGSYRWEWNTSGRSPLERVLWPIALSAAELLTSDDLSAVRICEAPDCCWLFLDHSRNRSRRWCDMKTCGNRQKARRHYSRTQS